MYIMRLFAKLLVSALVIWLLIVSITGLLGVSIQFPFTVIYVLFFTSRPRCWNNFAIFSR